MKVKFKDLKTGFLVVFYRTEEGTTPKTTLKTTPKTRDKILLLIRQNTIAIIPSYNEESTIESVIKNTRRFVDEVLVINGHVFRISEF